MRLETRLERLRGKWHEMETTCIDSEEEIKDTEKRSERFACFLFFVLLLGRDFIVFKNNAADGKRLDI